MKNFTKIIAAAGITKANICSDGCYVLTEAEVKRLIKSTGLFFREAISKEVDLNTVDDPTQYDTVFESGLLTAMNTIIKVTE